MADVEVQTTIFANPIKVPEEEVAVLRSQGLLAEVKPGPADESLPDVMGGEPAVSVAPPPKPAGADAGEKPDTSAKESNA